MEELENYHDSDLFLNMNDKMENIYDVKKWHENDLKIVEESIFHLETIQMEKIKIFKELIEDLKKRNEELQDADDIAEEADNIHHETDHFQNLVEELEKTDKKTINALENRRVYREPVGKMGMENKETIIRI